MSRVKTTPRAYRLGCGCVHEFASLPAVSDSVVVCGICGSHTTVDFRYPDSCCAATCRASNPEGGVVKVRCTRPKGHAPGCDLREHYDETVDVSYNLPGKLRAERRGNT